MLYRKTATFEEKWENKLKLSDAKVQLVTLTCFYHCHEDTKLESGLTAIYALKKHDTWTKLWTINIHVKLNAIYFIHLRLHKFKYMFIPYI